MGLIFHSYALTIKAFGSPPLLHFQGVEAQSTRLSLASHEPVSCTVSWLVSCLNHRTTARTLSLAHHCLDASIITCFILEVVGGVASKVHKCFNIETFNKECIASPSMCPGYRGGLIAGTSVVCQETCL